MTGLTEKLADFIDSHELYAKTYLDQFPAKPTEALMLRLDPSTAKNTAYFDGSSEGVGNYTLFARSKSSETAQGELEKIFPALDFPYLELDEGLFISAEPVTHPAFVQRAESGEWYYSFTVRIKYTWSK